jgi:hypothetical protein
LAPTTAEHATVHTTDPRSDALERARNVSGLAVLVTAALSLLVRRRRTASIEPSWRTPPDDRRPHRRGPPLRIA